MISAHAWFEERMRAELFRALGCHDLHSDKGVARLMIFGEADQAQATVAVFGSLP